MLVEIDDGLIVDRSQIVSIRQAPGEHELAVVALIDGRRIESSYRFGVFRSLTGTIIPAPSGYRVLYYSEADGEHFFNENAVLAFRYDGVGLGPISPITDEGEPPLGADWAIGRPDGTVFDWDSSYETEDAYRAAKRKEADKGRL